MLIWHRLFFHHELNDITDMTFVIGHLLASVREPFKKEIERWEKVRWAAKLGLNKPLSFNDWVQTSNRNENYS